VCLDDQPEAANSVFSGTIGEYGDVIERFLSEDFAKSGTYGRIAGKIRGKTCSRESQRRTGTATDWPDTARGTSTRNFYRIFLN
jgi:hypothetical protein